MDQYPFKFKMIIVGQEVDEFIKMLENNGFVYQAGQARKQFKKQLDKIEITNK